MAMAIRWFLGHYKGDVTCRYHQDGIEWNRKTVLVTASEGLDVSGSSRTGLEPGRFVGSANITVENIAPGSFGPQDAGIAFRIHVDWDEPKPIWVDIHVFDSEPIGFLLSR
jgi:hypothetical protein